MQMLNVMVVGFAFLVGECGGKRKVVGVNIIRGIIYYRGYLDTGIVASRDLPIKYVVLITNLWYFPA